MKKRRWTKKEENLLVFYWGEKSREWIAKKLDRTIAACTKRMLELTGSRSIKRGRWTQRQLAEHCGFQIRQIVWAVKRLQLNVRQPPKKRTDKQAKKKRPWDNSAWLINDEQADQIIYWLTRPRWERTNTYPCCTECGTSERPHRGKGLCGRCDGRLRARRKRQAALDKAA